MIRPGSETIDPVSKTRLTLIASDDKSFVVEAHCPPGAAPWVLEHIHTGWAETFEVVSGTGAYKLSGTEHPIAEGQTVELPAHEKHVHPWNTGDGELVYRQTSTFDTPSPSAAQDVIGVFFTIHGLAREGKINKRGLPKNPLQFGATLRTLTKHGGYDAAVPILAQNLLAATLGKVAELAGYRGTYPRYTDAGSGGESAPPG